MPPDADLEFVLYNSLSHDVDMCHLLLPRTAQLSFHSVETETSCSEFRIAGKAVLEDGACIDLTVNYSKASATYVQRVHVLVENGNHRQFGHEFFPQYVSELCYSSYEQAYVDQWNRFHTLCRRGEDIRERNYRLAGYARTFASLDEILSRMTSS